MLMGKRILARWLARARCHLSSHQWKRVQRTLGNQGSAVCKRCGGTRVVRMRAYAQRNTARTASTV